MAAESWVRGGVVEGRWIWACSSGGRGTRLGQAWYFLVDLGRLLNFAVLHDTLNCGQLTWGVVLMG